jgi:hypothetical protein
MYKNIQPKVLEKNSNSHINSWFFLKCRTKNQQSSTKKNRLSNFNDHQPISHVRKPIQTYQLCFKRNHICHVFWTIAIRLKIIKLIFANNINHLKISICNLHCCKLVNIHARERIWSNNSQNLSSNNSQNLSWKQTHRT